MNTRFSTVFNSSLSNNNKSRPYTGSHAVKQLKPVNKLENKFYEKRIRTEKPKSMISMSQIEEGEEEEEEKAVPTMEYQFRQDKVISGKQPKLPFARVKNGSPSRLSLKKAVIVPETIDEEDDNF